MSMHCYQIYVHHFKGEIGDKEKDQSMQAFVISIKVICPPLKGNRTFQGFLRELGGVAGENDNK